MNELKINDEIKALLCCPVCGGKLECRHAEMICKNLQCLSKFPVVDSIPILINEGNSIFEIEYFCMFKKTTFDLELGRIRKLAHRISKTTALNVKASDNFVNFSQLLKVQSDHPRVLIIGGSIRGQGMESLSGDIAVVAIDVTFGSLTDLIGDGHNIPFEDESFDGVVIQSVLEHVVDPYRCVQEIHRVLKRDGLVYAETPFMQQVHMGRFDFTRFSHLGYRRLFRNFQEIDSGACSGSEMAFSWAYRGFLKSFINSKYLRAAMGAFAACTSFFFKYFDYITIDNPSALDAASAYYFMGKKSQSVLTDRELIKLYRGVQR